MKKLLTFGVLASICLAGAQGGGPSLQPFYTKVADSAKARNYKTLETLFMENTTPNFAYLRKGKRYSISEILTSYRSLRTMVKYKSHRKVVEKTSVSGATAQLTVLTTQEFNVRGPDGKVHVMGQTERTLDTWIRQGAKWLWVESKSLSEASTMDGKPIPARPQ